MLIDTTLREGAQLFGAYFSMDKRESIVADLIHIGIDEIELGWIGQEGLPELAVSARAITKSTALSVWSPCRDADIRAAAELGLDRVNVGVPASDAHMSHRLGLDRDGLLVRIAATLRAAADLDLPYISVGLEDVSRADPEFALTAALVAEQHGAKRVRLSDSLGLWSPLEAAARVAEFRAALDCELAVHCHDDFGMATGNAVAALGAGADYADCSVLGIGERSGIAATEELAAYLTLKEESHAYSTDGIRSLCNFVSDAAGVPIPRTKAIAGKDIFACESGIHAHALGKSPELFEPYRPDAVGADRTVAVGGKSGRAAVARALDDHGLCSRSHDLPALLAAVKKMAWKLERPLTSAEFLELTKN